VRRVTSSLASCSQVLNRAEWATLLEERYLLDNAGRSSAKPGNFQPFKPLLLFTFRIYGKNHGTDFEPELRDKGWQDFQDCIEIRDRVTHPKDRVSWKSWMTM
jgi:hypothetical protein